MATAVTIDDFVDVVAVTGFLGSGKTTLIKTLLEHEGTAGTAVMVSEFGELGIDDAILADGGDGIVELQNGCICCRVGGSLEQGLRDLFVARIRGHVRPFGRLYIETSGMTDPIDMVSTLHSRPVREMRYRMRGTITAFDSQFGLDNLESHIEASAQLAAGDCVVLTKTDIVDPPRIADVMAALNPGTPVLRSTLGLGPDARPVLSAAAARLELTPAASAFRAVSASPMGEGARHGGVRSHSVALRGRVSWDKFVAAIGDIAEHGEARLLRVKGILSLDGIESPMVVHGVHDALYPPERMREWPFPCGESRLVLIYTEGAGGDFAEAARAALAATVVSRTEGGIVNAA